MAVSGEAHDMAAQVPILRNGPETWIDEKRVNALMQQLVAPLTLRTIM
jgi:hypothetical protein